MCSLISCSTISCCCWYSLLSATEELASLQRSQFLFIEHTPIALYRIASRHRLDRQIPHSHCTAAAWDHTGGTDRGERDQRRSWPTHPRLNIKRTGTYQVEKPSNQYGQKSASKGALEKRGLRSAAKKVHLKRKHSDLKRPLPSASAGKVLIPNNAEHQPIT